MQSPLKNALLGSLVRTLLIQVQKTKVSHLTSMSKQGANNGLQTDLSLSLLSLDHLLRSQQLTFAFVGVAPSFLILYGLGGYVRSAWKGEKRGKGRRRRYFTGLRDVERILLTAPEDNQEMTQRDRGLLIVSLSGMRTWAAGLGSSREVSNWPRPTRSERMKQRMLTASPSLMTCGWSRTLLWAAATSCRLCRESGGAGVSTDAGHTRLTHAYNQIYSDLHTTLGQYHIPHSEPRLVPPLFDRPLHRVALGLDFLFQKETLVGEMIPLITIS